MDISHALRSLEPNAMWVVRDDDYDQIEWLSPEIPKPDWNQIENKIEELKQVQAMKFLREERDRLLKETDWVVIKSQESGEPIPEKWKKYRQELRDLPLTSDPIIDGNMAPIYINNVDWPVKPQ
jgi:hypothetical protein